MTTDVCGSWREDRILYKSGKVRNLISGSDLNIYLNPLPVDHDNSLFYLVLLAD